MHREGSGKLIFAAVMMGAAEIALISAAIWALTFDGRMSRDLRRALHGHSLTTAGAVLLAVGIVLILCAAGVLVGSRVRWAGIVSRWAGIVIGAVGAISGIWYVADFSGWAIAYTVLGAVIVYVLTLYESERGSVNQSEVRSS